MSRILGRHKPRANSAGAEWCRQDGESWPCEVIRERDALREKAIAFGVHDAADLAREWGYEDVADRLRAEALARYARLAASSPEDGA